MSFLSFIDKLSERNLNIRTKTKLYIIKWTSYMHKMYCIKEKRRSEAYYFV